MILLLELKVANGTVPAKNPQQVEYPELIGKKNQHKSVEIFSKGKVIAEIKEIEIIGKHLNSATVTEDV